MTMTSEPAWHTEVNEDGEVVFVNRKTGQETGKKPVDWDGHYIIGQGNAKKQETSAYDFSNKFCTPMDDVKPNKP